MKIFVKCEICNAETFPDKCVFATHKKVIEDEEHIYCCPIMQRKHNFDRLAIDPKDPKKEHNKSRRAHTK